MSGDDIVGRSEDYERRLAQAGSTQDIIKSLVTGADRSRKMIQWLWISLILDVIISFLLAALGIVSWHNTNNIDEVADASCVQSAQNSIVVNKFLDILIENINGSSLYTPAQKKQRVAGYSKLYIDIPECYIEGEK